MDTTLRSAVRDGLGVGLAVGLSGVAFGAAAVAAGLGVAQACALSLLAFSGASQFALIGVVAGGGNLVAGAAGAVLLGGRNALYGLRLAETLGVRGWRRPVTAHLVIDETTAVATAQPGPRAGRAGFWATAISIFTIWNLTTLGGAVGASRLGDPNTYGLDVVGPAAFLALLWPRLRTGATERRVAVLGAAVAVGTTPLLPPGVPVMLAAVAALAGVVRHGAPAGAGGGDPMTERSEGTGKHSTVGRGTDTGGSVTERSKGTSEHTTAGRGTDKGGSVTERSERAGEHGAVVAGPAKEVS